MSPGAVGLESVLYEIDKLRVLAHLALPLDLFGDASSAVFRHSRDEVRGYAGPLLARSRPHRRNDRRSQLQWIPGTAINGGVLRFKSHPKRKTNTAQYWAAMGQGEKETDWHAVGG